MIDDKYNEEKHAEIVKQLEKKYLGKKTPDNTEIVSVEVDYRKDYQCMNRVHDEYGNIFFVLELEEGECDERNN